VTEQASHAPAPEETLAGAAPEPDVRAALEPVLASRAFSTSDRLRRFLRFVVEETLAGRADGLKEYTVATEVCDRPADFDPRVDPVVRVEARRLRARLIDYYRTEGVRDRVVFQLPKGGYVPVVEIRPAQEGVDISHADVDAPARATADAADTQNAAPPPATSRSAPRQALLAAAAIGLACLAFVWIWTARREGAASTNGVAVLPFQNVGADADDEHFCFGLVEDLTAVLTQVPGLRVVARTSSEQFKGGHAPGEVSRRLRVRYLVEGSVRREGRRLRVAARLVDATDGSHVWASTYDRDLEGVFAVQDELARAIGSALVPRLGLRADALKPRRGPASPVAYGLFLKGQFLFRTQPGAHGEALAYLEDAIAKDPTYAPAHLEAAAVHAMAALDGISPPPAEVALSRQGVERALALDPELADAVALQAWLRFFNDWDWPGAEQLFQRALALNNASSTAHHRYALLLMTDGRYDAAIAHVRQARDLDPLSYRLGTAAAVIHFCARRYPEAERLARDAVALAPGFYLAHLILGSTLTAQHRFDAAIAAYEHALKVLPNEPDALASLGRTLALAGRVADARAILARLDAPDVATPPSRYELAFLRGALGDRDGAFAELHTSIDRHENELVYLAADPLFDPLRDDPRWEEVVRRVGVPRQ
jgi:serine/threonine-protein kinase